MAGHDARGTRRGRAVSLVGCGTVDEHRAVKPTFFASQSAFRRWLEKHHADSHELPVAFYRKDSGKDGITYPGSSGRGPLFRLDRRSTPTLRRSQLHRPFHSP